MGKEGKRVKRKMISINMRQWADLPDELLDIISKNLSIADYLSFGGVCGNWRLFYSEAKKRFMKSKSPFIINISVPSMQKETSCNFFGITNPNIRYKTKLLPNFGLHFCIGISSGYLIMKQHLTGSFLLINPITGHQIQIHPTSYPGDTVNRAIFASVGSDMDFLLAILSEKHKRLSIFRDTKWGDYSFSNEPWTIKDLVVFDGRMIFLTSDSDIGVFNLRTCEFIILKLKSPPLLKTSGRFVASGDQLLIVDLIPWFWLQVYRIDFSRSEWIKVCNFGDEACFVGENICYSLCNTTKWGGRRNCVYHLPLKSTTCCIYSLNGDLLETFPIVEGDGASRGKFFWYFPNQIYSLDNVRDD